MRALSIIVTIALLSACSGGNEPEQTQDAAAAPGAVSTPPPTPPAPPPIPALTGDAEIDAMTEQEARNEMAALAAARMDAQNAGDAAAAAELETRWKLVLQRIDRLKATQPAEDPGAPPVLSTKPVAQMTLEEAKAELRVVAEARLHANRTNDDARSEELRQHWRALLDRIRALESGG